MQNKSGTSTRKIVFTALMAALTVAGSSLRITIPVDIAGTTSFHLGNIMCALGGILLGPWYGALSAGIGSALYDMMNPLYISEAWITFLTKAAYGLAAGLVIKCGPKPWTYVRATAATVAGALTYAVLYGIFALFLVGMLPLLFDIPHAASWGALAVLLIPYILGTSFLGLALSRWYTDAEAPILLIAFFSIGLIFLSGVSYPLELIPWYWRVVHYLIPAAPAVLAYVQMGSMESVPHDVWPQLLALYLQMTLYFALAVWTYRSKIATYKLRENL